MSHVRNTVATGGRGSELESMPESYVESLKSRSRLSLTGRHCPGVLVTVHRMI